MISTFLAEVTATENETLKTVLAVLGWVTSFAVAIIGALTLRSAKATAEATAKTAKTEGKAEGKAEALQIGPQPFMVELKEAFVTRREFDRLELSVAASVSKIEASVEKFSAAATKQDESLARRLISQGDRYRKELGEVAGAAYNGRQRIHVIQNEHTARIAALEAQTNVAQALGKLADALGQTKVQPTHTNNP